MRFWPREWPMLLLAGLAFFLPFERIGSLELAGVTVRISQILLVLLVGYFFIGFMRGKEKISSNVLIWTLFLFIGFSFLSFKNALNPERALLVTIFTAFTFCLPLLMVSVIKEWRQIEKIVTALLIGSLLVSLFGLFQFLGDTVGLPAWLTGLRPQYTKAILGFPRIQSTSLEPLYFANYLIIPFSFCLALLLSRFPSKKKIYLAILFIIILINLILTASRGGIAAALVSGAAVIFLMRPKIFSFKIAAGATLLFIAGLISGKVLAAGSLDPLQPNLNKFVSHITTLTQGAAFEERLANYKPAWRIWQENFWLGIGPGNFGSAMALHPYVQPRDGWKIVNNEPLELLAENGIIGFSLIVIFQIMLMWLSFRAYRIASENYKPYLAAGLAAWFGIWIQYQTFSVLYITHVWFTAGLIVSLIYLAESQHVNSLDKSMLKQ